MSLQKLVEEFAPPKTRLVIYISLALAIGLTVYFRQPTPLVVWWGIGILWLYYRLAKLLTRRNS